MTEANQNPTTKLIKNQHKIDTKLIKIVDKIVATTFLQQIFNIYVFLLRMPALAQITTTEATQKLVQNFAEAEKNVVKIF